MVLLVDLGDEVHDPHVDPAAANGFATLKQQLRHARTDPDDDDSQPVEDDRPNPNVNGFSAALSCYPVVSQLGSVLDLNDLHNLSRTCRQFRANLLEYRDQLVRHSLHCANEDAAPDAQLADRMPRLTSGKVGKCARDLVSDCDRCGTVVCRNCTIKPPSPSALKDRHRRLCNTCSKAPIASLTQARRRRSASPTRLASLCRSEPWFPSTSAFTSPAFQRHPCNCETSVWLCQPCGQSLRAYDIMYLRGWTWRTTYTRSRGGIGTGIGEGIESVECGRKANCLAARTVEHETECDAESLAALQKEAARVEAEGTGRSWKGTSYMMQEVEGVGGVVKRKAKKLVKVGAGVKEFQEEHEKGVQRLEREANHQLRSWCDWCERVVPGPEDLKAQASQEAGEVKPESSKGSSGFSIVVGR
ncbi:hypothetical protein BU16DRAFT_449791 [Lophium mytilinum]|uniref:F-box domain-containing protein n=1 Tax=Lophium mytilinum TaxID=390894 RepID=A0A6A6RDJ6_9PEZI|nr:hypothetical protein BU16DRAFT_449791 [Lophium mytilinum]